MKTLALDTLGNTEAARTLVEELNKLRCEKTVSRVCKYFSDFSFHMRQLDGINHKTKIHCASMLKCEFLENITDRVEWGGNIRSLLKNVIHSVFVQHTCWEIEVRLNKETFGRCDICRAIATIRYRTRYPATVIGKYCEDHKYQIQVLHKKLRASTTEQEQFAARLEALREV